MADYDRRELSRDLGVALRANNTALQSTVWTALPGFIVSFDAAKNTCQVQTTLQMRVLDPKGVESWVTIKPLVDCPVVFPSGGGYTLTFPLRAGDECLVVFSARCIDSWWHSGGIQIQNELRMHDLSDGFVMPGPRSLPNVAAGISTTDVQLRSDDGLAYVSINPAGDISVVSPGTVAVVADTSATVTAPVITLNGNVTINGTLHVTGVASAADFATPTLPSYIAHIHQSRTDDPTAFTKPPKVGT